MSCPSENDYLVVFPNREYSMLHESGSTPHEAALKACERADWQTTEFTIAEKGECHCVVTDLKGGESYSVDVVVVKEPQYRTRLWREIAIGEADHE
jgi:hypothetical protein